MAGPARWRNWAGNQRCLPAEVRTPLSTDEVARAVQDAAAQGRTVRMIGTGHSFTGVAATSGLMLRPHGLTRIRAVGDGSVTVEAGCPLHVLNRELDHRGLALANLGDIAEQTVAGAVQTGTHGSGRDAPGGLADQVTGMELVLADGSVAECGPGDELFDAARVGLGALGIVTAITFRVVPAFRLQAAEGPMRLGELIGSLDKLIEDNDHLDCYWFPHTGACSVKRNNRTVAPAAPLSPIRRWVEKQLMPNILFEQVCRLGARFPSTIKTANALSAKALGSLSYVDTSHRVLTSPREVRFLEQEYAIPREHLGAALREVKAVVDRGDHRIGFPAEVRVVPPSDAWLSTAYGRATAYIAVHVYHRTPKPDFFRAVEDVMTGMGGRPHWGKLHTRDAAYLSSVYARFEDFIRLRDRLDPQRIFSNTYLDRVLG